MKSFRIPVFKKIVGAINKALGNDEVAIVPRADGIYVVYKEDGISVEKKIYDQRHNTEIAGMATGLGENVGAIRKSFIAGQSVRAEELCSVSSGEPTEASVTGTTSVSLIDDFIALRDNEDNGKISFSVNGENHLNIPVSLETKEFNKEEVVNHVNYAGTQTASSSRGMTIQVPSSMDQCLIKSFKLYLAAGKTYTVKTYRGNTLTDKIDEQTIIATETKFHTVNLSTHHILNKNDKITIIVEASSFDYYYPASTAVYKDSWSDGTKDSPFSILNTLPIKLDIYPCIALDPNDIKSVIRFIVDKINETITDQVSYLYTDRFKLYFAPGFLEFETKTSNSVDLLDMLGFKSGRVTVYGEGYQGAAAAGLLVRLDGNGKIPFTKKTVRIFQVNANATHTVSCGFRPSIITAVSTSNYSSGGTSVGRYENGEQGSFGQHSSTPISSSTEILKTPSMNAVISNITDDGFDIIFVASSYYNNVILTIFE